MNNFYVYQHLNQGGQCVFVGMGQYNAAWCFKGKKEAHVEFMKESMPSNMRVIVITHAMEESKAKVLCESSIAALKPKFNKEAKVEVEVKAEKPAETVEAVKPSKQKPKSAPKSSEEK
jgi:cell envelope opacity-associated protein A